jgi:hypothetical protein
MAVTAASKTLQNRIVSLLQAPANTSTLNFKVKKKYRSRDYNAVGEAIKTGRIQVFVDSNPAWRGTNTFTYNEQSNHLYLSTGFTGTGDQYDATIVHEATHAVEDGSRWKNMTLLDTEVAGYVAQFLFLLKRKAVPAINTTTPTSTDKLFSEALEAAKSVLSKGWFPEKDLRHAITNHPEYKGRLQTRVVNSGY